MQDVLIVSYLVSKEFNRRSIFDHSDDCCEDLRRQRHRRRPDLPIVIPDLSCALPLRCPNNELDRGPMTRNALSALSPKADMCSARGLQQRMSALPPIAISIAFFGTSALGQWRT